MLDALLLGHLQQRLHDAMPLRCLSPAAFDTDTLPLRIMSVHAGGPTIGPPRTVVLLFDARLQY